MTAIWSDALLILRVLSEGNSKLPNITAGQIKEKTGLDDTSFESADNYLLKAGYVEGTFGGLSGLRWLTVQGIDFLEEQMSKRVRLSLSAEKIAKFLFDRPHINATISQIRETFGLEESDCQAAAHELIDEGLVEDKARASNTARLSLIGLTSEGRKAVRNGFILHQPAVIQQNVGALFYGSVTDSNVLAVAQAHQSRIQQVIRDGDTIALRDAIDQLLKQVVSAVKEELTTNQLAVYEKAARRLQTEIKKDKPNSSVIQRCLNVLSFTGDLDGTIELGKKTMELALKVGPMIPLLQQAILGLLN